MNSGMVGIACVLFAAMTGLGLAATGLQTNGNQGRAAYFVAEFTLNDAPAMRPYAQGVAATLVPYGGEFVARGGNTETVEGDPVRGGIVIIRFPSVAKAHEWYGSAAYAPLKAIRLRSASTRAYITAGLAAVPVR